MASHTKCTWKLSKVCTSFQGKKLKCSNITLHVHTSRFHRCVLNHMPCDAAVKVNVLSNGQTSAQKQSITAPFSTHASFSNTTEVRANLCYRTCRAVLSAVRVLQHG